MSDSPVSEASPADVDRAVAAARAAFPAWSNADPLERGQHLKKLAALIKDNQNEFSRLDALSWGSPLSTNFDTSSTFEHYAEEAFSVKGTSNLLHPGYINMTYEQPIGVVGIIIPWNIPMMHFCMHVAPALAAGCTVVVKSSEKAPLAVGPMDFQTAMY